MRSEGSATKDLTGTTIGNYDVVGLLGKGGMATVYRARQETMGRDVAIKIVPHEDDESSAMILQRFEREVRLIAQLQHPQILPVFDFGQTTDFTYLVMRLVETGTLADRLERGPFTPEQAAHILDQVASALDHAHQHGIVHRDLKPANVFLDTEENVYLADFGIAKLLGRVDTQLTATGFVLGTPAYMPPEQITDQPIDRRADVYALGLILFEMLTGQQVFSGSSAASVIFKHVSEPPPVPSSVASHLTPQIDAAILKALAKSPDDRYQTAGELAAAFRDAIQPQTVATAGFPAGTMPSSALSRSATPPGIPSPKTGVDRKWLIGGGLLLLVGGGLLTITVVVVVGILLSSRLLPDQNDRALATTTPQPAGAVTHAATPTPTLTRQAEPTLPAPTATTLVETPAGESPKATATPTPTVSPTVEPETRAPDRETATPPPTATPTDTPTATPEADRPLRVGRVLFLTEQSRLDTVNLQLAGIEAAPSGKHYEGWLVSDSGSTKSIGLFSPDNNGNVDFTFTDPDGKNLAGTYSGFRASLEPDFGDSPEISQEVVLEGAVNGAVIPLVREAVLRSSEVPLHSLLQGLETEAALGLDHLGFARNGLAEDNLAGGLNHVEHVINILVGNADTRFGDKNDDGQAQNPGDDFGVIGYLNALLAKARAATQADPTSAELLLHAGFLEAVVENSIQRADGIVQLLERGFAQDSAASALTLINQALALYDELLNGLDTNGNEAVEPTPGEGGILLVVQHTGYLANIEVYRVQKP